jgi:hypothetical protein
MEEMEEGKGKDYKVTGKGGLSCLDQVRTACAAVASRARYVQIKDERIPAYAASLPLHRASLPELDPTTHFLDHGNDTLAFFITLDAINFGSGYFPHLRKRPGMSGYFTVAASLNEYYCKHGPFSAERLAHITKEDCTRIFGQGSMNEIIQELMQLLANGLNDLGNYLLKHFDGSFIKLVESADSSAERLVQILTQIPYFNDVEPYDGMTVPFYKRAQLTAADLSLAFDGKGLGSFNDLDQLTIFADNLVPHVLRVDGILVYEEDLAHRIDTEQLIPPHSEEEVEIRACAVHAVELIKAELQKSEQAVTSMELDYLLWNRGQQAYYKHVRARHRTRTIFY